MISRPFPLALGRLKLKLGGAALALSLGLASCGSSTTTTTTTTPSKTFALTVNFTGSGGTHLVTVTAADGNARSYTLASGGAVTGLKGVYTVLAATAGKKTPAAQTVDLSSANQTITFAY